MIETLDERNAIEPLVLKRLNDAFGHSNGRVLSYGSEAWLHIPSDQQLCEYTPDEYAGLIRNNVLGSSMFFDGAFQSIVDPSGISSFQRSCADDLTREMINHDTDLNGPYTPIQHICRIDRPNVIGIPGRN